MSAHSPKTTPAKTTAAKTAAHAPGSHEAASPTPAGTTTHAFAPGGVRTILRHNPAHEIVAARMYLRGGSSNLSPDVAGVELVYARAARQGTQRFAKEVLNAELARMGADLGAAVNEDCTVFHLRCLRRDFDAAWELFTDTLLAPRLEPADFAVVREQTLLKIRERDDEPDGRLANMARQQVYAGHPYASDPAGTQAAVAQLVPDSARAHMTRCLVKSRLVLVLVGNVTRPELEAKLERAFAALPDGALDGLGVPSLQFAAGNLVVEARDLPTNYIIGQFSAPSLDDATYPAFLIAMSHLRDRVFEEVRTKRNLSYAPSAGLGNNRANLGWIYVTAVDPKTTLEIMRHEMHQLRSEPMQAKDLQDKVQVYATRYYLQNETSQAQASFLGSYELLGGGWERSAGFVARLEALTPEEVRAVAAAHIRNLQFTYLGNPAHADPTVFVDP